MTVRSKRGSPISGAATSNSPAKEGGAGASSGFAGKAALSKAVCSSNAMIKLRRRNPVTEMARLGSRAGSKWFAGRLYRRFAQAACGFVDCAQWDWGAQPRDLMRRGGEVRSLADKISTRIESRLCPATHYPKRT